MLGMTLVQENDFSLNQNLPAVISGTCIQFHRLSFEKNLKVENFGS